jgi:hypothetical protein
LRRGPLKKANDPHQHCLGNVLNRSRASLARRYEKCRIVATCRTLSYQNPAWQLGDFENVTLAPFSEEQIERFIAGWHGELARLGTIKPGAVEGVTRQLRAAVRRPDLW